MNYLEVKKKDKINNRSTLRVDLEKDVTVVDIIPAEDFCMSMFYIIRYSLLDEVKSSPAVLQY